jgi:hypothetical protein
MEIFHYHMNPLQILLKFDVTDLLMIWFSLFTFYSNHNELQGLLLQFCAPTYGLDPLKCC